MAYRNIFKRPRVPHKKEVQSIHLPPLQPLLPGCSPPTISLTRQHTQRRLKLIDCFIAIPPIILIHIRVPSRFLIDRAIHLISPLVHAASPGASLLLGVLISIRGAIALRNSESPVGL